MGLGCTCGIGWSLCLHVTIWGDGLVKKKARLRSHNRINVVGLLFIFSHLQLGLLHPLGFILLDIPGPVGGGRKGTQKYHGPNLVGSFNGNFVGPTAAFGRPEGLSKESKDMQL